MSLRGGTEDAADSPADLGRRIAAENRKYVQGDLAANTKAT